MTDIEEEYAINLKNKYGDNFFVDYLRTRGAPINIRNGNQISGLIYELRHFLERDGTNIEVLNNIRQFSYFRNDAEINRAIDLLTHLGITYNGVRNTQGPQYIDTSNTDIPATRTQSIINADKKSEKVELRYDIPENSECPICLENINETGYYTEKCYKLFHKECLDKYCKNKANCVCPMCRRTLKFSTIGGKIQINRHKIKTRQRRKPLSFARRNSLTRRRNSSARRRKKLRVNFL
jgi:hypothetical protein